MNSLLTSILKRYFGVRNGEVNRESINHEVSPLFCKTPVCTLTLFSANMFFKIIVLKQAIENSSFIESETQNSLTLTSLYHPPRILQNMFSPYL